MKTPIQTPDTRLVIEAQEFMKDFLPVNIYNHSLRTFILAQGYGVIKKKTFDREALFLAGLYHDIGFFQPDESRGRSFQEQGAFLASGWLRERKVDANKINTVTEAIAYHMRFFPPWSKSTEAGLLQVGAWMDIAFLRRWSILELVKHAEEIYPRLDINRAFASNIIRSLRSVSCCSGIFFPRKKLFQNQENE